MDLTCKFVFKEGSLFGESIDVYGNYLIIKVESSFLAVPKDCIEKVEGDSITIGDFDVEKAKEVGGRWMEEKSKPVSLEELKGFGFSDEE